jgi:hypothetical protein
VHVTTGSDPRAPHRVPIGVVARWRFPSKSIPGLVRTVTRYGDGSWGCDCPGYEHQARHDGLCRHIDQALEERPALTLADVLS